MYIKSIVISIGSIFIYIGRIFIYRKYIYIYIGSIFIYTEKGERNKRREIVYCGRDKIKIKYGAGNPRERK